MNPIARQVVVVTWLVALHAAPYGVVLYWGGTFRGLLYIILAGLSGPFAQAGLLGFYLIAGTGAESQRRLLAGSGLLAVVFALGLLTYEQSFVLLVFPVSAALLVTAIAVVLATRFAGFRLERSLWPPRFTLWEIAVWLLLAGVVFGVVRWLQVPGGSLFPWDLLWDEGFLFLVLHGTIVGFFVTLCGFPFLARGSSSRWSSAILACLAAGVLPMMEILVIYLFAEHSPMPTWEDVWQTYQFGLAVSGLVACFAWGTMIPWKFAWGTSPQGKPESMGTGPGEFDVSDKDMPAGDLPDSDDFQNMQ